jgi:HSF-type DNA-binding
MPSFTYPRTGKRGVPQQFPRRLSEMLECEAQLARTDPTHKCIITWSDSGKAFRILNVALFSSRILPKYFRTSKFSSFQRNLNLVRVHRRNQRMNLSTFPNQLYWLLRYSMGSARFDEAPILTCMHIQPSSEVSPRRSHNLGSATLRLPGSDLGIPRNQSTSRRLRLGPLRIPIVWELRARFHHHRQQWPTMVDIITFTLGQCHHALGT